MNKLKAYFSARTERERQILLLGVLVGVPLFFWLLVWQPLLQARAEGGDRLQQRRQTLVWMQEAAATVVQSRGAVASTATGGSPQQLLTAAARELGLKISRIEPQSRDRYSVWVARTDYNSAVRFIEQATQGGLILDTVNMNLLDTPGMVSLRVVVGDAP